MSRNDHHSAARSCPACACTRSRPAFDVAGFAHVKCLECGSVFVSPVPGDDVIRATNLDPHYHHDLSGSEERMRAEARVRAEAMQARGCRRVLEIGCGAGFFVEALLELGIDAEGVDPGPQAQRAAERGLPIHPIWLGELELTKPYDGIAMFELLEHLPDPLDALRWSHRATLPGATLALSTPSASGLPARVLGPRFPMYCPPDHLEVFTKDGLQTLLQRGGFQPFHFESFSNLDRDALQRGFQRFALGSSAPARRVAGLLATLAAKPVQWVDRAGFGTSYEVHAVRV